MPFEKCSAVPIQKCSALTANPVRSRLLRTLTTGGRSAHQHGIVVPNPSPRLDRRTQHSPGLRRVRAQFPYRPQDPPPRGTTLVSRGPATGKPVLGPFVSVIHQILDDDRHAPPKQRHTGRRIYERLCTEHGYAGCASIVRAAVTAYKQLPTGGLCAPAASARGSPMRLRPGRGRRGRGPSPGRLVRLDLGA